MGIRTLGNKLKEMNRRWDKYQKEKMEEYQKLPFSVMEQKKKKRK